jgi:nucleotide-binding universal stress UspA family protein
MFDNVLVGVDEREGGRDAIALAKMLISEGGRLTFSYVYHGDPHRWHGSRPPLEPAEEEHANRMLEKAREEAGVSALLRCQGASSVGRGLHELGERIGADLLVVGSSRRGLIGRVLLGDDTRAALNGAPCAVAIAPAGYAREPSLMREIGVGYNGSPESEHAVKVARTIAARHGAKLSALEAVSIPEYAIATGPMPAAYSVGSLVEDALEHVSTLDEVEPHAIYGHPAEELALYSASTDLLVLGSRSYGPIGRIVHGSTSHRLARTARCPLLILTRAAREAEKESAADNGRRTAVTG